MTPGLHLQNRNRCKWAKTCACVCVFVQNVCSYQNAMYTRRDHTAWLVQEVKKKEGKSTYVPNPLKSPATTTKHSIEKEKREVFVGGKSVRDLILAWSWEEVWTAA